MAVTIGCVKIRDENGMLEVERIGYPETRTTLAPHQLDMLERVLARITQPRKRMGFRVDARNLQEIDDDLRVTLQISGQTVPAAPIDLSLSGVRVFLVHSGVYVGQRTSMTLELGDECVMVPANVVRVDANEVAFQFDTGRVGEEPPVALVRLYRRLELAWLRARSNGDRPPSIVDRGRD
ncbi:MAG: PilZ domain-containing protein [Alphaproteobacteria bacterium]|nr:PilZ domain-containing protein [Alphaproteobacteria bacterium]MCB9690980.1 PilZ domain-containing protein [Alphaproteobacteria bacterium]